MDIVREAYLEKLFSKSWNGKVKIITGIRRCGKSYLLSAIIERDVRFFYDTIAKVG